MAYAATLLWDATHDWWTAYLRRRGEKRLLDWESFQIALQDRFGSKLRAKQALANIVDLTQGTKPVREYVAEFDLNTGSLDSFNEVTLMQFFIWVLHKDIVERVSITHPTSLSQAIATAEEIEVAVTFSRRPPVRTSAHPHSGRHSLGGHANGTGRGNTSRGNPKGHWR